MIIFSKFQWAVLDNQGDPIPVRIIPMRRGRLSQYKQNKLIELSVAGVTARTAAQLVGTNKNTAAYYFHRLRLLIFHSSPYFEILDGEVEADESYFGGHRKGRRGAVRQGSRRIRAFKAQR